MALIPHVASGG